jgi:hypothetical protein
MYEFKKTLETCFCRFTGEEGNVGLSDESAPLPEKRVNVTESKIQNRKLWTSKSIPQ